MTDRVSNSVTVLGLGLMGRALARAFLKAGHPTTVWNRTASKTDALVADGAHRAESIVDALRAGTLVVVCVSDYAAIHQALDPHVEHLDGRLLVNLTSGDSRLARETAAWANNHGAHYLDGAIMAVPPAIGTAEAVILHSGPQSDFESHEATLSALGTVSHLGADHGLASLYDVAGLAMMWSVLNAWLQGTAMLRTAGVNAATYAPFAQQIANVVAEWLPRYAEQVDSGSFPAEVSSLETDIAAMEHLLAESQAAGVSTELPRLIKTIADRAVAAGRGREQYPVLIEEFSRSSRP
ncbi:3-hydroxyisobutyrate dehydrogenase-like beta-hydroxyacid dehydrogenase [Prauserella sediminis]|uniref:3-hydroxyisobutyrate dehydrogenase-like beta-hydroxyacid dehydrogenase n=1 Tax=Prauserella sediminis TaxID=577680 RepID=A0A839XRC8_9PSEU|nr:NAD(P)-binding domain-containing protein [Prauserella sediminis]MBB3665281.1 3-hydroxyisobutyrate dehydrogenase-like beta-hydroxyacid dehydrogenase [Prauserella sediminis]